jgi:hypothetical protein
VLEPEAVSSDFVGMVLAYFGCLHRISSNEMSSAGWIILLVAPVVAIVLTLEPSPLLGVFVVGGALIVAAEEIGLKSAPTIEAPGDDVGMALGNSGFAGPP